jgi:hypothetical protein
MANKGRSKLHPQVVSSSLVARSKNFKRLPSDQNQTKPGLAKNSRSYLPVASAAAALAQFEC